MTSIKYNVILLFIYNEINTNKETILQLLFEYINLSQFDIFYITGIFNLLDVCEKMLNRYKNNAFLLIIILYQKSKCYVFKTFFDEQLNTSIFNCDIHISTKLSSA